MTAHIEVVLLTFYAENQMASMRLELTLTSARTSRAELGRYVLEHSASTP